MAYKRYNRALVVRIVFLVVCAIGTGVLVNYSDYYFILVLMILLTLVAIYTLLMFVNKTTKQISYFIQAIKNDDTTLRFPRETGNKIINELHAALNELNAILQETKIKSQIKERYFSEILENIGTGVVVFNAQGFVINVNPAALQLFGMNTLTHKVQFDKVDASFRKQIETLHANDNRLLDFSGNGDRLQLITRCSTINLKDEQVKLLTFENIKGELERKEIDSWVKLIRVLSHEIMNSLTPVTSIAQSLKSMWADNVGHTEAEKDCIESTVNGLEVIGDRGQALIRFVNSYRMLTRVPQPRKQKHGVQSVMDSLNILVSNLREEGKVEINFESENGEFELEVDMEMFTQVIINLVKNAVEAAKKNNLIKVDVLFSQKTNDNTEIKVIDNGPGIDSEIQDQIFVPFFSTKEGGSGVGLSHSRQIIRAHGGSITCKSEKGRTEFIVLV